MSFYRIPSVVVSMACAAVSPSFVQAQTEARSEIAREAAAASGVVKEPGLTPVARSASSTGGASSEFGEVVVIEKQAAFEPWRVEVDLQGYHTDNVALAPRRVEDWFFRAGLDVSYLNRLAGGWNAEFFFGQDSIRYDRFDSLDFEMTRAGLGLSSKLAWLGDTTLLVRYQFEYLAEPGWSGRILNSHSITAGLIKSWKMADGQRLYLGLVTEPDLTADPDLAVRHENGVHAGWSVKVMDKLTLRLAGRASFYSSPNAEREDWNYMAKVSATYEINDWASVGATTSMMWNRSSKSRFDYRNQLAGAFLGFEIKF